MQGTKYDVFESRDDLHRLWQRMRATGKRARTWFAREVEAIWNAMRGIDDDAKIN